MDSNSANWEQRKFEHDWALQGDLRQGMTEEEVSRMPRTSTLPKFRFNDPNFHYTDEDLHPSSLLSNNNKSAKKKSSGSTVVTPTAGTPPIGADGYPTTLQKLDMPPPSSRTSISGPPGARDPDAEKMKYLMQLESQLIKAQQQSRTGGYDPQISEQEQLEEAQLAKQLENKPLLADRDGSVPPESSSSSWCCCFKKKPNKTPPGYEAFAE